MYVCMYVCMYVGMYVHTYVRTYIHTCVRMYVCMFECMYVCMYSMYVCTALATCNVTLAKMGESSHDTASVCTHQSLYATEFCACTCA